MLSILLIFFGNYHKLEYEHTLTIMKINQITNKVKEYNPRADTELIQLAFDYAKEAHEEHKRKSGEDYIQHPLETAYFLAKLKMDDTTIAAALLHDVPEDTEKTLEEVQKNFGKEIASLVEGITKLGKVKYRGMERYIENLRKMFVAMAADCRVILIKFADRIHNLKTLEFLPEDKRKRIALETIEIYAPIANRLGMGEIKGQLEDLAFPHILPEEHQWLMEVIKEHHKEREKYINKLIKITKKYLDKKGISSISVHGRAKHYYSLYKKLLLHDKDISKIHDLIALRVIVNDIKECYNVLGLLHDHWKPLKGRIKDYIAQPKPNGYRSLHTTVFCEKGKIVEFQIKTRQMHEEAEYGVAAHWHYDESGKPNNPQKILKDKIDWLNQLIKLQKEVKDERQYLESIKLDIFQDHIFVFTPKGDVIDLPEEATPIDFAYHIHSDIGNRCVGVKINEKMVSLETRLKSGDVVEIITDKNRKGPSADWLEFAKTHAAKSKIKTFLSKYSQT